MPTFARCFAIMLTSILFVLQSVSGSWFLSSRRLSNPRFTLTSHYCCLAYCVVSSISPPTLQRSSSSHPCFSVALRYHDFLPQPILTHPALLLSECHTDPDGTHTPLWNRSHCSLHHHLAACPSLHSQIAAHGACLRDLIQNNMSIVGSFPFPGWQGSGVLCHWDVWPLLLKYALQMALEAFIFQNIFVNSTSKDMHAWNWIYLYRFDS